MTNGARLAFHQITMSRCRPCVDPKQHDCAKEVDRFTNNYTYAQLWVSNNSLTR